MNTSPASIEATVLLARTISLFANVKSKCPPASLKLLNYLNGVRDGRWRRDVEAVREANKDSKTDADRLKVKRLPVITPSGTFRGLTQADLVTHSGILCIDLDDVGPDLEITKERLKSRPCVLAIHLSPRATGLKVFLAILANGADEHAPCWKAAVAELQRVLPVGVKIDPAPSNVVSKCFVSYDPDTWVATTHRIPILPLSPCLSPIPERKEKKEVISEESVSDEGRAFRSMSDSIGEKVSAETARYTDEIQVRDNAAKTRQRARRELERMGKEVPRLRAIYRQYLETKAVNRNERHDTFLLKVIPPMFEVVAEEVLTDLLRLHHRAQTGTWETGIEDHMREVSMMLVTYDAKYRRKLTARECAVFYDRFDDEKRRTAFRICRGLATCARATSSGAFFLSCRELATRINCHPDTANVILRELKAERLIECVTVGDSLTIKLPPGEIRKASTWRWIEPIL